MDLNRSRHDQALWCPVTQRRTSGAALAARPHEAREQSRLRRHLGRRAPQRLRQGRGPRIAAPGGTTDALGEPGQGAHGLGPGTSRQVLAACVALSTSCRRSGAPIRPVRPAESGCKRARAARPPKTGNASSRPSSANQIREIAEGLVLIDAVG